MTVSALNAVSALPVTDDTILAGNPCTTANVINPGDWVIYSGTGIAAAEDAQAYFKASGAGIALDRNPVQDWAGRTVVNSALIYAVRGVFRVSAAFSGQALNGLLAYPSTTGSAVNAPTGLTGVGAKWQTANPVSLSAAGATGAPSLGVAIVLGVYPSLGPAGTGQMDIRLFAPRADYY